MEKANIQVTEKLIQEGEKLENYNIVDGFAFYRGSPVNYGLIKRKFEARVKKFIEKNEEKLSAEKDLKEEEEVKETKKEVEGPDPTDEVSTILEYPESSSSSISLISPAVISVDKNNSITGFITPQESPATRIGIFFNLNGTSKTRKNVIFLNKKAFKVDELTSALLLEDKTKTEKEKTARDKITVERIQACYSEETQIFLKKKSKII